MTSTARDRLVAVVLIVVGATAIWSGTSMSQGAGIFPVAIGALIVAVAAIHFVTAAWLSSKEEEPEGFSWRRFLVAAGLAVAFFFLIEPLGTFVAIPVYLVAVIVILSSLGWAVAIAVSVGFSCAIFIVFELLLEVPTPPGLLESLLNR